MLKNVCVCDHLPSLIIYLCFLKVYNNQLEIERQSKAARQELSRFRSNVQRLGSLVRKVSQEIKEAGDLENYISVLEELSKDYFQNQQSGEGPSSSK